MQQLWRVFCILCLALSSFKESGSPSPTNILYTMKAVLVWPLFLYVCLSIVAAKTVQTKFDANTLHTNRALAAETQMVDDGSGKVEVRVKFYECIQQSAFSLANMAILALR